MKFFAILFLLCGILGLALSASSTTLSSDFNDYGSDTVTSTEVPTTTTSAPPAQDPCGSGPKGPCGLPPCVGAIGGACGKKLYFFF
ncbi:uncharacterized protein [Drosophila takahashii]|uniref:uncharacterized protein n=1 Tax=Drosophila takahashii TaxID=29030 RepID=UPI001CF82895|nr:uncharacterized protein LOC108054506 [Drosophila takahashii]